MTRDNYQRFMDTYNQSQERYKASCFESDSSFLHTYGKVWDTNTIMDEYSLNASEIGVYVDIFPVDGIDKQDSIKINKLT